MRLKLLKKARQYYTSLEGLTVAVLGLTFKPGTNDLREAPSILNVGILLDDGAKIKAYDPIAEKEFNKWIPMCTESGVLSDGRVRVSIHQILSPPSPLNERKIDMLEENSSSSSESEQVQQVETESEKPGLSESSSSSSSLIEKREIQTNDAPPQQVQEHAQEQQPFIEADDVPNVNEEVNIPEAVKEINTIPTDDSPRKPVNRDWLYQDSVHESSQKSSSWESGKPGFLRSSAFLGKRNIAHEL